MKRIRDVRVGDVRHPTLCYKQQTDLTKPSLLARCAYPKGHAGPHQWERTRKD
jgi:hypothetical protein